MLNSKYVTAYYGSSSKAWLEAGLDLFKPQCFSRSSHRSGMSVPERDKAPT